MKNFYTANRINSMPTSIFTTISQMANEFRAVNLGQGFPDFSGPDWIAEAAFEAAKAGKNQYAPTAGIFSLRNRIRDYHKKYYSLDWNSNSDITITAGATEALFSAIHAFIDQGDEVIMFEPYYDSYQADVILAGGTPRYVTLYKPDFTFKPEELEKAFTSKTKMIIVNSPHNPTGKVFTLEELTIIAKLAIKHDVLVLTDEVYEFLTFDGEQHIPIASLEGMKERTITVSSTGKTFGMTGWKIGYAIAEENLTQAIRKIHQWTTFAVNTPAQHAMAHAFTMLDQYIPDFRKTYQEKRDYVMNELKDTAFTAHLPKGSYFIMLDIPKSIFPDDFTAASQLVKDYGLAAIPTSVFYSMSEEGKTMLRLCFAKAQDTLIEGINRLKAVL